MIVENEIGMSLPGEPRWWTVSNAKGSREVVRVAFDRRHFNVDEAPADELIVYVVFPTGTWAFPPLVAGMLQGGSGAWKALREESGVRITINDEPLAQKLELMLMAGAE